MGCIVSLDQKARLRSKLGHDRFRMDILDYIIDFERMTVLVRKPNQICRIRMISFLDHGQRVLFKVRGQTDPLHTYVLLDFRIDLTVAVIWSKQKLHRRVGLPACSAFMMAKSDIHQYIKRAKCYRLIPYHKN